MANSSLHDLALEAQTNIHELATGLAHAGADPQAVSKLSQFAEVLGDIAKAVNQNPVVEHAAANGPPVPGPATPQPQPQAPTGLGPSGPSAFHGPSQQLSQAMQASAAQRG